MFRFLRLRWGTIPALAALSGLLFHPRLFGHAQLVTLDFLVAGFWFLSTVTFVRGCETGQKLWLFGFCAGLTVMSKATGILVLPALLVWVLLFRPPHAIRQFAWAGLMMPIVAIAIHPGWWSQPIDGPLFWAESLLDYKQKIPIYYWGQVYDSRTLFIPWHSLFVLPAIAVPIGLLILGLIGLIAAGWMLRPNQTKQVEATGGLLSDRALVWLAICNAGVLLGLRLAGLVPCHDGFRQWMPALVFAAVVIGYGARFLCRSQKLDPSPEKTESLSRRYLPIALVALCIGQSAWETWKIHPYELAYYNQFIGGPSGAKAAGFETTYYWDSATTEVLQWMNRNLPPRATVLIFPPPDVRIFAWQQHQKLLRPDLRFLNFNPQNSRELFQRLETDPNWYLIFQIRQGHYFPKDSSQPSLMANIAEAPARLDWTPANVGTRLLAIFSGADVVNAAKQFSNNKPR